MSKIIILFLPIIVFATNILNTNVYERPDRIDIMLSFDSPYKGEIIQKETADSTVLTLKDLQIDKPIEKNINSKIINSFFVKQDNGYVEVSLKSNEKIEIVASKTIDEFGLRIRARQATSQGQDLGFKIQDDQSSTKQLGVDSTYDLDYRYYIVILILFILILILFYIKKKIPNLGTNGAKKGTWLFNGKQFEVNILYQKNLDMKNKVILIEHGNIKYLILSGTTNVLLDKFQEQHIESKDDFEEVFEENRRRLDNFLKLKDKKFEDFKEKASATHFPD